MNDDFEHLSSRFYKAFAPILAAIVLDFADLATFGPIGLSIGWLIGGMIGYWMGGMYRLTLRTRLMLTAAAALYCAIPMTELIPLATILTAAGRFFESPAKKEFRKNNHRTKKVVSKVIEKS